MRGIGCRRTAVTDARHVPYSLGGGVVAFEVQQNSDVTFSLYDWDRVDAKTGQPRALQIDQALACIDFAEGGAAGRVTRMMEATAPVERESLFPCEHFWLWRLRGPSPFAVGAAGVPRVLACIEGAGQVEHEGATYAVAKGDVLFLPAVVGVCAFLPSSAVSLLEIGIPEMTTIQRVEE
jgi:mannose-6-phosphate isomerase